MGNPGDDSARRLERLTPLVHDLLSWHLVARSASGTFVLTDDVQRRLQDAATRQERPVPQVFVGRPCQRCATVAITQMVDGERLCLPCSRPRPAAAAVAEVPMRKHRAHFGPRLWRDRDTKAG